MRLVGPLGGGRARPAIHETVQRVKNWRSIGTIASTTVALGALAAPAAAAPLRATLARDRWGVPHVAAADYAGLGYGYGYALAQDNLCVMEDTYMTVRAERSRYLGPGGSWEFRGNGT